MTHFGIICPASTGHLKLQQANQQAGGVISAADIIEQVISTGKPVLASLN